MLADKDAMNAIKRILIFRITENPTRVLAYVNQPNLFTLSFDLKVNPNELFHMTGVHNGVNVYDITDLLVKLGVTSYCGFVLRPHEIPQEAKDRIDQITHPTYRKARERFHRVQEEQIMKGADKYPEPLNHRSWSFEDLQNHAMQELVDQVHYVEAMGEKYKYMEDKLKQTENFLGAIRTVANNTYMPHEKRIQAIKEAFDRMGGGEKNDGNEK